MTNWPSIRLVITWGSDILRMMSLVFLWCSVVSLYPNFMVSRNWITSSDTYLSRWIVLPPPSYNSCGVVFSLNPQFWWWIRCECKQSKWHFIFLAGIAICQIQSNWLYWIKERHMTKSNLYRPKVNLPDTRIEKIYDGVSTGCVIVMVVLSMWILLSLPETIPIHWNLKGEADGFGSRYWMILVPILSVSFYFGNTKLVKIPHAYNYLKTLTPDNFKEEYVWARKLLRVAHLLSQLTFLFLVIFTIKSAFSEDQNMPSWLPLVILLLFIATPFFYMSYKDSKSVTTWWNEHHFRI